MRFRDFTYHGQLWEFLLIAFVVFAAVFVTQTGANFATLLKSILLSCLVVLIKPIYIRMMNNKTLALRIIVSIVIVSGYMFLFRFLPSDPIPLQRMAVPFICTALTTIGYYTYRDRGSGT